MEEEKKIMMFGKSQSQIGNTNSHTTILTAGDIYIKTKNKYVPIFRNGKLNVDNSSEIFAVESVDAIKKTGIYLVTSTSDSGDQVQSIYLNVDGTKILLASSNDGYISYSTIQELKPEDFLLAAQNIGLYFNTVEEAKAAGITKGMVYILEEQKLYKVVNGELVDMNAVESSQPSESEEQGKEEEETDSLKIGCIFLDGTVGIIDSESRLVLQVDGTEYIKLLTNKIYPLKDIVLDQARQIYYQGGTQGESGFWVYTIDGESYIETDNLIVHNASSSYSPQLYSTYIGSPSKSMIDSASWASAPTDIQLQLKYPESFEEGDHVVVFIGGGNQAKIGISQRISDSGVTEYYLTVALSAVPTQITTLLVTCEYETDNVDSEGDTITDTVQVAVTIDPDDMSAFVPDEGESADDEDGATGNLYGEARAPVKIVNPLSIEIQSGDPDVFFINEYGEQSGGSSLPTPMTGTVISQSPLIINVPTQQSSADSILLNLKYSNIYKLVSQNSEQTVLVHEDENISLTRYTDEGGAMSSSVTTRIGNLSSIKDIENPEEFLEGHGIYTDNLVAVMPRFRGGAFVGDTEEDYPRYGANLTIPEEVDSEEYDNVIPTVGWVKALIEKMTSPPSILP